MKVTLVQTSLYWENREKNLAHIETLLNKITATQLIVLPEMFTTGFTMKPELMAEESGRHTLEWMRRKALEKNCVITGSVSVSDSGKYFNRLYWVEPDGNFFEYNKRHLFRMGKEDEHYSAGTGKVIADIEQWKLCPLVCYDLRFPVWSRNKFSKQKDGSVTPEYDVLLYVANWPAVRSYAWKQLLIARAIENQCYVIGVNRIGEDGNGIAHSGDSVVINPRGEIISGTKANEESVETVELDWNYLTEFRKVFPVGMDADEFELFS